MRRHADPGRTTSPPTPSCSTLLTGPRWAIGPRDLALLGRRARELAGTPRRGREPGRGRRGAARRGRRRAPTPTEVAALGDALEDPGRPAPTRRRPGALRACSPPSCAVCGRHAGEPLLDLVRRIIDTCRDRRRARLVGQRRPPRPGATTSTCSSRRSRSSRPSTATVTLPALLAWLDGRGRPGRASTSPPRPRPTRSSCSPSTAPRAWSGTPSFLVGVCEDAVPAQPQPRSCGRPGRARSCRRRCAATRATCRRCGGYDKAALDALPVGHQARTRPPRSSGWATSRSPGRAHRARGVVVPVDRAAARPRSAPRRTSSSIREVARRLGRASRWRGWTSRRRGRPTRCSRRSRRAGLAGDRAGPREARAGSRPPSWSAAAVARRARRPGARRGGARPGSPSGTPSSSGCSPRRVADAADAVDGAAALGSLSATARGPAARRPGGVRRASWPGRCRGRRRRPPGSAPASTPGWRPASASRS